MEASSASSSTVKLIRKDTLGDGDANWSNAVSQGEAYAQNTLGYTTAQATSRLITYDEAVALQSANSNLLYGTDGYSSGRSLAYWTVTGGNGAAWCVARRLRAHLQLQR